MTDVAGQIVSDGFAESLFDGMEPEVDTSVHSASYVQVPIDDAIVKKIEIILPSIRGQENAITVKTIARCIGEDTSGTSPKVRKALKHMLCDMRVPICSGPSGVFVAKNLEELEAFRDNLVKRRLGLERNIDALDGLIREAQCT